MLSTSNSRRRRRRRAAATVDYDHHLPVEVVEEIICKLPVKHVLRCKSLSKTYYALIKNPRFINTHLNYHKANSTNNNNIISLIEDIYDSDDDDCNIDNMDNIVCLLPYPHSGVYSTPHIGDDVSDSAAHGYTMKIVGSCNGLLCAQICLELDSSRVVLVWNPATREKLILPPPPSGKNPNNKNNNSYDVLGFGYDATSHDYKLVITHYSGSPHTLKLWCSKTNTWKDIKTGSLGRIHGHGVFAHGNLYWLLMKRGRTLTSFGMADETFCTRIKLPTHEGGDDTSITTDHMGSLAFVVRLTRVNCFVVWVMDDHETNSWTRKYSLGPFPRRVRVISFNVKGKFLTRGRRGNDYKYFLYDPSSGEKKRLHQDDGNINGSSHLEVFGESYWSFTESLVSLN